MAFFDVFNENTNTNVELNDFDIVSYEIDDEITFKYIQTYYSDQNNNAYDYYVKLWRDIDLNEKLNVDKIQIFDQICNMWIDTNEKINDMCSESMNILVDTYDTEDMECEIYLKMLYARFWPMNAVRMKAYVDRRNTNYLNGKISSFEYLLKTYYQEKITKKQIDLEKARGEYIHSITTYRDYYFDDVEYSLPDNNFFLDIMSNPETFEYKNEKHLAYQANLDAIMVDQDNNDNFLLSFQSYFNKELNGQALKVNNSSFDLSPKELKKTLQRAKLKETEIIDEYNRLFSFYIQAYKYTFKQLQKLTSQNKAILELANISAYPLKRNFEEIDKTFSEVLNSSLKDLVDASISSFENNQTDDYIIRTEKQIRNYYQGQLAELINNESNEGIEQEEIILVEEYKVLIDEFRNLCTEKINYNFRNDYPKLNQYSDYSFSLGERFTGLDKRTIIESAIEAAKKGDLSLHTLKLILLKVSEYININSMDGDASSSEDQLGPHEVNVIMEKYAAIEQKILIYGKMLAEIYLHNVKKNYNGDITDSRWKEFLDNANELLNRPITTFYETNFDIATVQRYAQIDNKIYESADQAPFYTKMKNLTQQKIYDVNDSYLYDIEEAKQTFIDTGKQVELKKSLNNLRTDIDRIIDEYKNMSNYYIKEFKVKLQDIDIVFDKGKHYYFQSNNKEKGEL